MFETILVPLDGTPEAAVVLPPGRAIANAGGAGLHLVRVIPDLASMSEARQANAYLRRVADELGGGDVPVSRDVRAGTVPDEILAAVHESGAGLIAMATHGRAGVARAFLGSVAQQVLERSPVPMLLVRPGGHRTTRLRTLLVPVDGTAGGALALAKAVGLARASGARLVLLQVVVPIPTWLFAAEMGSAFALPDNLSWDEEALGGAQHYVRGLATRLQEQGIPAEGRAAMGEVAATIASTAEGIDADLIVMSSRGLTGPARTVLGSTADAVVRS